MSHLVDLQDPGLMLESLVVKVTMWQPAGSSTLREILHRGVRHAQDTLLIFI